MLARARFERFRLGLREAQALNRSNLTLLAFHPLRERQLAQPASQPASVRLVGLTQLTAIGFIACGMKRLNHSTQRLLGRQRRDRADKGGRAAHALMDALDTPPSTGACDSATTVSATRAASSALRSARQAGVSHRAGAGGLRPTRAHTHTVAHAHWHRHEAAEVQADALLRRACRSGPSGRPSRRRSARCPPSLRRRGGREGSGEEGGRPQRLDPPRPGCPARAGAGRVPGAL